MPKRKSLTPQQQADIARLYPTMMSKEVAERVGCSADTVRKYAQCHGIRHTPEFENELKERRIRCLAQANLLSSNRRKVAVVSRLRAILIMDRENELTMPSSRRISELLIAITDLMRDLAHPESHQHPNTPNNH